MLNKLIERALEKIKIVSWDLSREERLNQINMIVKECFEQLEQICKNNKLYENPKNKELHQHFWEIYLANFLLGHKINLKKDLKDGSPDFYFHDGNRKIHIEAKAPNNGNKIKNRIKEIPIISFENNDNNDFMAGIAEPKNCIARFINIISEAEKQYYRRLNKTISKDELYILAINGRKAVGNNEYSSNDFTKIKNSGVGFHLFCSLFNLNGDQAYYPETNELRWLNGPIEKENTKIYGNFFKNENCPITGIIYSNVNYDNFTEKPVFLYFQNPNKEDLRHIFNFCNIPY